MEQKHTLVKEKKKKKDRKTPEKDCRGSSNPLGDLKVGRLTMQETCEYPDISTVTNSGIMGSSDRILG